MLVIYTRTTQTLSEIERQLREARFSEQPYYLDKGQTLLLHNLNIVFLLLFAKITEFVYMMSDIIICVIDLIWI